MPILTVPCVISTNVNALKRNGRVLKTFGSSDGKCEPNKSATINSFLKLSLLRISLGDFYKLKFCHSDIYMYICIVKQE